MGVFVEAHQPASWVWPFVVGAGWLVWLASAPGARRYAALGLLTGVAALMRWQDVILLIPIALDLVLAWRRRDIRLAQAV